MNFIKIFEKAGIYTAKGFNDGVALTISRDIVNRLELKLVRYKDAKTLLSEELSEYRLTDEIVNSDFIRTEDINNLFGDKKEKLFEK